MNVNPVGGNPAQTVSQGNGVKRQGAGGGNPQAAEVATNSAQGEAKGVVRLLQEGHFKGVAAARLRINFSEQLSGIQTAAASSAAGGGVESLLSGTNTLVEDFIAAGELDEAVVEGITSSSESFNSAVSSLIAQFQGGEIGEDELIASLQASFDEFDASLVSFLAVPDGGEGAGEPVEGDPPAEPSIVSVDFTSFLESLREGFSQALENFAASLTAASSTLPELSEPNGNGVAFAKFVDILEGLSGTADIQAGEGQPEVDVEV